MRKTLIITILIMIVLSSACLAFVDNPLRAGSTETPTTTSTGGPATTGTSSSTWAQFAPDFNRQRDPEIYTGIGKAQQVSIDIERLQDQGFLNEQGDVVKPTRAEGATHPTDEEITAYWDALFKNLDETAKNAGIENLDEYFDNLPEGTTVDANYLKDHINDLKGNDYYRKSVLTENIKNMVDAYEQLTGQDVDVEGYIHDDKGNGLPYDDLEDYETYLEHAIAFRTQFPNPTDTGIGFGKMISRWADWEASKQWRDAFENLCNTEWGGLLCGRWEDSLCAFTGWADREDLPSNVAGAVTGGQLQAGAFIRASRMPILNITTGKTTNLYSITYRVVNPGGAIPGEYYYEFNIFIDPKTKNHMLLSKNIAVNTNNVSQMITNNPILFQTDYDIKQVCLKFYEDTDRPSIDTPTIYYRGFQKTYGGDKMLCVTPVNSVRQAPTGGYGTETPPGTGGGTDTGGGIQINIPTI